MSQDHTVCLVAKRAECWGLPRSHKLVDANAKGAVLPPELFAFEALAAPRLASRRCQRPKLPSGRPTSCMHDALIFTGTTPSIRFDGEPCPFRPTPAALVTPALTIVSMSVLMRIGQSCWHSRAVGSVLDAAAKCSPAEERRSSHRAIAEPSGSIGAFQDR